MSTRTSIRTGNRKCTKNHQHFGRGKWTRECSLWSRAGCDASWRLSKLTVIRLSRESSADAIGSILWQRPARKGIAPRQKNKGILSRGRWIDCIWRHPICPYQIRPSIDQDRTLREQEQLVCSRKPPGSLFPRFLWCFFLLFNCYLRQRAVSQRDRYKLTAISSFISIPLASTSTTGPGRRKTQSWLVGRLGEPRLAGLPLSPEKANRVRALWTWRRSNWTAPWVRASSQLRVESVWHTP